MRLDKFICSLTDYSRKEIKKIVRSGAVTVNGHTVSEADMRVDETGDTVCVYGKTLVYKKYIYLMMNKPAGYLSATEDKRQPVVTELLGDELARFAPYPAGRLDIDAEGLLILTNDGDFAHKITSPKKEVYKRYFVRTDIPMTKEDAARFSEGMELGDFTAKPAVLEFTDDPLEVYIMICEGKFHQVKRMCRKCGKEVVRLKRTAIGSLILDESLAPGEARELGEKELEAIFL